MLSIYTSKMNYYVTYRGAIVQTILCNIVLTKVRIRIFKKPYF
jgi:hypothetical protein